MAVIKFDLCRLKLGVENNEKKWFDLFLRFFQEEFCFCGRMRIRMLGNLFIESDRKENAKVCDVYALCCWVLPAPEICEKKIPTVCITHIGINPST